MSQRAIIELLEQNPEQWMSTVDLREALRVNTSSISLNVKRLRMADMVEFRKEKKRNFGPLFYYKHKEIKEE